jgi:hypothetical protein
LRIEPIHDRVDEHPFVPVVVEQDYSDAFAKLKRRFLMVAIVPPKSPRSNSDFSPKSKTIQM